MKVLMTCDAVGGVWQYATDLSAGLAGHGVEVVLATLGPRAEHRASHPGMRIIDTGLPLDWLADGPEQVLATGRAVANMATGHGVDLIHLNAPALAAAGGFACPVVAVAHGCIGTWFDALAEAPGDDLGWHAALMAAGLRAADVVVAPSASFAATLTRCYQLATPPRVIHNGRSAAAVTPGEAADHVLTAGRLWDRAKNTAMLDAIAGSLPVPLRAAGPVAGPHGETVSTQHLRLLGTLTADALVAEYAARPIYVSAARFEPFGLAVLEAAQAGCPLVLAGIDTFRELWTGAALLVPDNDAAGFVAAIARVRSDPVLRAHLSAQASIRAGRYTIDAMTTATLALYRALLPAAERRAA